MYINEMTGNNSNGSIEYQKNKCKKDLEEFRNETYFEKIKRDRQYLGVYHIILSVFLMMVVQNTINDYFYDGRSKYGFKILMDAFRSYKLQFIILLIMILQHFLVYYFWKLRIKFRNQRLISKIEWIHVWPLIAFVHFFVMLNVLGVFLIKYNVSTGCRFFLLWEHFTLSSKGYAFIRTNMDILKDQGSKYKLPTFSHYAYFTVIPSLVYKEEYLRSTIKTNWIKVFKNSFELFAYIYLMGLLYTMYIRPQLKDFGKQPFNTVDIIYNCWKIALPCYFYFIFIHGILINAWPKCLSEVTSFGERKWHLDWWTSSNMTQLYIKWNNLVQDNLYFYIYKDLKYITNGNNMLARIGVLTYSMILHELFNLYICEVITLTYICFMYFSITQYSNPDNEFYNFLMLLQMYIGLSTILGLLFLEMFAKENCANRSDGIIYFPRLWYCETN